jgi:hypothetical protein
MISQAAIVAAGGQASSQRCSQEWKKLRSICAAFVRELLCQLWNAPNNCSKLCAFAQRYMQHRNSCSQQLALEKAAQPAVFTAGS